MLSITTTGSLLLTYRSSCHSLGLGYQHVAGDTPFDYVTRGAIWLTNSMQMSDFNAPNERSWQLNYAYDLSGLGLPGLKRPPLMCVAAAPTAATPTRMVLLPALRPGWAALGARPVAQIRGADGPTKNLSRNCTSPSLHRANSAQRWKRRSAARSWCCSTRSVVAYKGLCAACRHCNRHASAGCWARRSSATSSR